MIQLCPFSCKVALALNFVQGIEFLFFKSSDNLMLSLVNWPAF